MPHLKPTPTEKNLLNFWNNGYQDNNATPKGKKKVISDTLAELEKCTGHEISRDWDREQIRQYFGNLKKKQLKATISSHRSAARTRKRGRNDNMDTEDEEILSELAKMKRELKGKSRQERRDMNLRFLKLARKYSLELMVQKSGLSKIQLKGMVNRARKTGSVPIHPNRNIMKHAKFLQEHCCRKQCIEKIQRKEYDKAQEEFSSCTSEYEQRKKIGEFYQNYRVRWSTDPCNRTLTLFFGCSEGRIRGVLTRVRQSRYLDTTAEELLLHGNINRTRKPSSSSIGAEEISSDEEDSS